MVADMVSILVISEWWCAGGKGASEFIDMNLDNLEAKDVGYVVFFSKQFQWIRICRNSMQIWLDGIGRTGQEII